MIEIRRIFKLFSIKEKFFIWCVIVLFFLFTKSDFVLAASDSVNSNIENEIRQKGADDLWRGEDDVGGTEEKIEEIEKDYYKEFYQNSDMEEISRELVQISQKYGFENNLSFADFFSLMIHGNVNEAIEQALDGLYHNMSMEVMENRRILIRLIALIVLAAIFHNYSSFFKISFVGEQGFYITYMMIAMLLMQSFTLIYAIVEEAVTYLKDLMLCMLPAFYMSLMMCTGITTSQMVNSMFLSMLTFVEKIILSIILPGVKVYFLIVVLNQINQTDRFSKLAGLIQQVLVFALKSIVTGIIGLNMMKSILIPVYENAKYSVLHKGLSMIPGGTSISGLSSILMGAGVLIKNSIGVTSVLILLVLGSIPLLKILCFYVFYKLILALVQPISDNRILTGIQGAVESTGLLLRATATSIVLSILSIAIVLLTTNVRLV